MSGEKRLMGKSLLLLAVFLLITFFSAAQMAEAETVRTMYLKQESFSYMYKNVNYEYVNGVFGEGEKVKIYGEKETGKDGDKKITFYKTKLFGKYAYIPAELLTSKKPKYSYSITHDFQCLQFSGPVKVYDAPYFSSGSRLYEGKSIYTLGMSRYWYKAYLDGKPCFIRKDDGQIEDVLESQFPKIIISEDLSSGKKNIRKRLYYMFSMLPQDASSIFLAEDLLLQVDKTLPKKEFEDRGASGYALRSGGKYQVYIKEDEKPYILETSFFHEAGHILFYMAKKDGTGEVVLPDSWKMELSDLNLREYYHTKEEYIAELFEIYVKQPEHLLETAPDSFQFVREVLLSGSSFS